MILDTLSQAPSYRQLGRRFAAGLEWLEAFSPATPDGRYDIEGDDVFALVQSYETVPATEKKYESHRLYADIQYIAEGSELVFYAPITGLPVTRDYDEPKDCLLYSDPSAAGSRLVLEPGMFAIFLAHDAHKPGCLHQAACRMKKVVIKVRL